MTCAIDNRAQVDDLPYFLRLVSAVSPPKETAEQGFKCRCVEHRGSRSRDSDELVATTLISLWDNFGLVALAVTLDSILRDHEN